MIGAEEAGSGADGAGDSRTTPTATARTTAAAEAATGTAPPDGGDVSVVQPRHRGGGERVAQKMTGKAEQKNEHTAPVVLAMLARSPDFFR